MSQTWTALAHQPTFPVSTMLLLTDGSVMCQSAGHVNWSKLTPDPAGSYLNGSWTALSPMHHTRLYYASAVLKDGRVLVAGGEYSDAGGDTITAEIYDPNTDIWTVIPSPPGWDEVGDAPCAVLPDGRVLLGQIDGTRTALYDPATNTWSPGGTKGDRSSEESWVLLPDGTVETCQCTAHPGSEKYIPASNSWMSTGPTLADLVEAASIEIGPGILLPNGRAFFVGATPHTALYTPGALPSDPGTWNNGPAIPPDANGKTCGAKDAPACLQRNGHVVVTVGPVDAVSGDYLGPTYFYEYNGKSLVRIADPPNAGSVPYVGRMLLLPTGEILYASGTAALYAYSPGTAFDDSWRPQIISAPGIVRHGGSYTISGRQLNGLSQAVGYGDDAAAATNYPIVRLESSTGQVYYCRTFDHDTMAVATGTQVHSTNFVVPYNIPFGSYSLVVIANGIPSHGIPVAIILLPHIPYYALWQYLIGSLADGPLWVLGPHGPIPVDPWGPKLIKEAEAAREALLGAYRAFVRVGSEVANARLANAGRIEATLDPDFVKFEERRGGVA